MPSFLLSGTDTEVGKTIVTSALAAYWLRHYPDRSLGVLKLLQAGEGDREWYDRLFSEYPQIRVAVPAIFAEPLAPPVAAALAGERVDLQPVWSCLDELQQTTPLTLVEALGGLGSPVTEELTVADIAAMWHLPVVLVVPVRLGAIAQSVANVALARQTGVDLRGIVLNCQHPDAAAEHDRWTPIPLIERLTGVPILGTVPYLEAPDDLAALARVASNLDLEALLPSGAGLATG